MMNSEEFDYDTLKKKTLSQLRTGKSLFEKDGAFVPLLKSFIEAALEEELDAQLDEQGRKSGNRKNGKISKQLKTSEGTIELSTLRDRSGNFEPQLIKKRETILAENLEKKIIGMYGLGMSLRDISAHIKNGSHRTFPVTSVRNSVSLVEPIKLALRGRFVVFRS